MQHIVDRMYWMEQFLSLSLSLSFPLFLWRLFLSGLI